MLASTPRGDDFSDSWVEGEPSLRWSTVIPAEAPHAVANTGDEELRFVAVYAAGEVVTRYAHEVQPDGGRERRVVG